MDDRGSCHLGNETAAHFVNCSDWKVAKNDETLLSTCLDKSCPINMVTFNRVACEPTSFLAVGLSLLALMLGLVLIPVLYFIERAPWRALQQATTQRSDVAMSVTLQEQEAEEDDESEEGHLQQPQAGLPTSVYLDINTGMPVSAGVAEGNAMEDVADGVSPVSINFTDEEESQEAGVEEMKVFCPFTGELGQNKCLRCNCLVADSAYYTASWASARVCCGCDIYNNLLRLLQIYSTLVLGTFGAYLFGF